MLVDMESQDRVRAADADREAVGERLRAAVDEGRLDLHEYDDRLRQAYAAKTYGELDRLLTDLPAAAPVVRPASARAAAGASAGDDQRRDVVRAWLADMWRPWASVVTICVAIWTVSAVASAGLPYFWPVWVAGPWGAVLLFRTIGGLASGEPRRWAEHRQRRRDAAGPVAAAPVAAGPVAAAPVAAEHATLPVVRRRGCC